MHYTIIITNIIIIIIIITTMIYIYIYIYILISLSLSLYIYIYIYITSIYTLNRIAGRNLGAASSSAWAALAPYVTTGFSLQGVQWEGGCSGLG